MAIRWKGRRSSARDLYSTLTIDEICAMPVGNLAAPSAHLWLWAVNNLMEDAYRIVRAWGFNPITLRRGASLVPASATTSATTPSIDPRHPGKPVGASNACAGFMVPMATRAGSLRQAWGCSGHDRATIAWAIRGIVRKPAASRLGCMGLRRGSCISAGRKVMGSRSTKVFRRRADLAPLQHGLLATQVNEA